ncbi:MAG: CarD family transcriptional regulator [bacterium]
MDIGQSVIYPHYGAGEIIDKEKLDLNGETHEYYVINIHLRQQTVKIPANNVEEVGVRELTKKKDFYKKLEEVRDFIDEEYDAEEREHPEKIHQQTLKVLLDDVQQGKIDETMEGLKKLHTRFLDQKLNITEKRVYDTVQQFVLGEIMGIEGCSLREAEEIFNEYLPTKLPEPGTRKK